MPLRGRKAIGTLALPTNLYMHQSASPWPFNKKGPLQARPIWGATAEGGEYMCVRRLRLRSLHLLLLLLLVPLLTTLSLQSTGIVREGFSVCYKASKQPLKTFGRVHTTEGLLRYASSSSFHTLAARR